MGDPKKDETQDLTAEDRTLGDLLHGLNRVDAPVSFDSQVRARIAGGEPRSSRWRGFPVPVYAASLAAVLLIGALLLMRGFYWTDVQGVPEVANAKKVRPAANEPVLAHVDPQQPAVNNNIAPTATNEPEVSGQTNSQLPLFNKRNQALDRLTQGGSIDRALGSANQQQPRGFDTNVARRVERIDPNSGSTIPVTDFLTAIGIEAGFQGQELKVTSVRGGSPADKSGVQARDVIDAIGDTKITPATKFRGTLQAKSLTVIRGGKSIKIKFSAQ